MNIIKGTRVRVDAFVADDSVFSGMQMKVGATRHTFTGICRHFWAYDPNKVLSPDVVMVEPDEGQDHGLPLLSTCNCVADTHRAMVVVKPSWIVGVIE